MRKRILGADDSNSSEFISNKQQQQRLQRNKRRRELYAARTHTSLSQADSLPDVPTTSSILPKQQPCKWCAAKRFYLEPTGFCCMTGQIHLVTSDCPPEYKMLFTANSEEAKEFRLYIRTYNSTFAFTSFGVKYDKDLCRRNQGIYTFRIQGQVYHYINDPGNTVDKLSNLQLYFYDTDHEVANRMKLSEKLRATIVNKLMKVLHLNPYSMFFRSLIDVDLAESHSLIIRCHAGLDQRVYNTPLASQVAAIWSESPNEDTLSERNIIVRLKSGQCERVHYYFGCYDPLQYPLLFPHGETGWHYGIKKVPKNTHQVSCLGQFSVSPSHMNTASDLLEQEKKVMHDTDSSTKIVSCREYYCYKLQIRLSDKSVLMCSGRLLQQFCVDMYVKIETSRLQFFRNNQNQIRADLYQGIIDSVCIGEDQGSKVGHRIILPQSFIGGPRDLRKRYIDAMALVQRFGKPDLFITMTCNPSWAEIKAELGPNEEAQNRPDLIARVFRAKMVQLIDDVTKKQIFGKVAAFVYVIEFQKRGLPHIHLLVILESKYKLLSPESYDLIVCAELPGEMENPHLFSMVIKHMMHGPCGQLNPKNVCMKKGCCKNHYPKCFEPETRYSENSYPVYRRRNDGRTVKVRGQSLDNRWVVPYQPYLLAKYDCHINVEVCSTIKAVKYLYKYIYKGHDKVAYYIAENHNEFVQIDEIEQFQSARWISPPEAIWRIYAFALNDIYPSVIQLQLHLENQQFVTFKKDEDLNLMLKNDVRSKTMLTEFFYMNASNEKAKTGSYLYREFPEHFVWSQQYKMWTERKTRRVIGRIVTAHPFQGDRYYLRLLLNNIRGPTSFRGLRTINGVTAKTFREAALLAGLLESDNSLEQCLEEAVAYQMPTALRRLFATILVYCAPNNPKQLWEKFHQHMSEDYAKAFTDSSIEIQKKTLQAINSTLQSMGKDIRDFNLCCSELLSVDSKIPREIEEELSIVVSDVDINSITLLSTEQRVAFEKILDRVLSGKSGIFFIDGPGGTCKTFLYKSLLAAVRSKGFVALATASSGVAASILPGGRTAHSRFKIPIDVDDYRCCNIGKQSGLAELLRMSKLIIWDEAPMVKRQNIEALNDTLQDLTDTQELFGGKVIVFGGDFRQIPPVIPKGTKFDCINASIVNSTIWKSLEKIKLTQNMRAITDPVFSDFLLRIGNGTEPIQDGNNVKLPTSILISHSNLKDEVTPLQKLINHIFPNIEEYSKNAMSMINSVVLTPKNDCVDEINMSLINTFPGTAREYTSIDKTIDPLNQGQYEDFLNSLSPSGLPPYKLCLKKNCPIILLRNIDPAQGLCNGTQLVCRNFDDHIICAEIAVGAHKGNFVFIPRIPLQPSDHEKYPVHFTRTQFPIKLCFAMTINKAQGQTLNRVGVYLPQPVFSHGQLYVALSRATSASAVKVLIESPDSTNGNTNWTKNVVYQELLALAQC